MKTLILILILFFIPINIFCQDQNFLDFQTGRIAFEKHNDCKQAELLLTPIKDVFKDDLSFVLLYSKVMQCLGRNEAAMQFLIKFNSIAKNPQVDEEIAELNYRVKVNDISGIWRNRDNPTSEYKIIFNPNENTWYYDKEYSDQVLHMEFKYSDENDNYTYYTGNMKWVVTFFDPYYKVVKVRRSNIIISYDKSKKIIDYHYIGWEVDIEGELTDREEVEKILIR